MLKKKKKKLQLVDATQHSKPLKKSGAEAKAEADREKNVKLLAEAIVRRTEQDRGRAAAMFMEAYRNIADAVDLDAGEMLAVASEVGIMRLRGKI